MGSAGTDGGLLVFSGAAVPGALVALLAGAPPDLPPEEPGVLDVDDAFEAPLSANVVAPGAELSAPVAAVSLPALPLGAVPLGASTGLYPLEDAETSLEGFSEEHPMGATHAARIDKANQRRAGIFEDEATERKERLTGFS